MSPFTADGFRVLLACLPPVAAGFLLLRRVAPAWAAFGGLVTGLAVLPAFRPSPAALGAALASAIPLAVEVLLILYGGIALFAVLRLTGLHQVLGQGVASLAPDRPRRGLLVRSEEHTSGLQSRENVVCRPLL